MAAPVWLQKTVANAIEEDLGRGDVTSEACVPPDTVGASEIIAKATGVLAGMDAAREVARQVDETLALEELCRDGDALEPGVVVARVRGLGRSILAFERLALNFIQQLSGVATLTHAFVAEVAGTGTRVVDTRKTVPGLRALQKQAVLAGGGHNHRFGLHDAVLIKDNHIALAGGVREALEAARASASHMLTVEIEVTTPADAETAAGVGADVIMLDNMTPEQVAESIERIAGRALTEVSGGISLDTIRSYATLGVDIISVGALTHSAVALDLSLDITEWPGA